MMSDKGLNLWETLPEECKSMILSRLTNKEAARIARVSRILVAFEDVRGCRSTAIVGPKRKLTNSFFEVSKEFDQVVKNVRDAVQLLVLPPDLSPWALQGLVASHRNLKSLSFKRCSGKVKKFLPILEAAAGGKLDSKWYHRRSLETVDFRSCLAVTDVDVNALCVLHSRLEDVNLANCQGIGDVALTVLSRYQQSRPTPDDCTPDESVTSSTDLPEENDASPLPLYKGSSNLEVVSDQLWPELSSGTQKKVGTGGVSSWGPRKSKVSQDVDLSHTELVLSETFEGPSLDAGEDSKSEKRTPLPKSYAQTALKAVTCDITLALSGLAALDVGSDSAPLSANVNIENSMHRIADGAPLPYIDWTNVMIPVETNNLICNAGGSPNSSSTNAVGRRSETDYLHKDVSTGKKKLYERSTKLFPISKMTQRTIPKWLEMLQQDTAPEQEILRKEVSRPAISRRSLDSFTDAKGTKYYSLDLETSGDKRYATRRVLHIPNSHASTSEADFEKKVNRSKDSKAIRVGGATQVTNQRLDMPSQNSARNRVEAFRTTQSDLSLFMVSSGKSSASTRGFSDTGEPLKVNMLDTSRSSRKESEHSERSTPLPIGLESLQVGATMRHGKHRDIVPDLLEYELDPTDASWKGSEMEPWRTKGLRSVSVAGCNEVTDKGVQALLRGPSKESLVSLDISRCSGVTSAGLRLPPVSALEVLTAAQLPNISRLLLQLSSEGSLQHLNLAGCPRLDDLHLVAPYLQTLNLSNCKKLMRLQLKCPELLSCNLSLCESLETIGRFSCGALQSLNAYGCRLLTQTTVGSILESSLKLEELRCGGCDRLERLDMPHSSLLHLEVPGCSSLRRLYLHSRVLKVVDACGCKNLAEVYLYSSNLRRMLFSNCALLRTLVIPLDSIKESLDKAVSKRSLDPNAPQEGLEISISGCNVSDSVRKNLARLTRQWKATFSS